MASNEKLITGFGLEIPSYIEIAHSDDADYYEGEIAINPNMYWDTVFTATGLKLEFGSDRYFIGKFEVEESGGFDSLYVSQEKSFRELEDDYAEVKCALFKLKKANPEFEVFIGDAREVKFLNKIIYS